MSAIRVVVAEDQTMVLGALAALLELNADIHVIAQAGDGKLALQAVEESRPDVLIGSPDPAHHASPRRAHAKPCST